MHWRQEGSDEGRGVARGAGLSCLGLLELPMGEGLMVQALEKVFIVQP